MPEERLDDYLTAIDAAADWTPITDAPLLSVALPIAATARPRRMDMTANNEWHAAWKRGLISDVEMAWYTAIVRDHPASWVGWLNQYL